jgi:hypothetical protein
MGAPPDVPPSQHLHLPSQPASPPGLLFSLFLAAGRNTTTAPSRTPTELAKITNAAMLNTQVPHLRCGAIATGARTIDAGGRAITALAPDISAAEQARGAPKIEQ